MNSDNATDLFEACSGKSYERTLELLAARFPRPDVRDSIRRLPERATDFTPDIECARGATVAAGSLAAPGSATVAGRTNRPDSPTVAGRANAPDSPAISPAASHPTAPAGRALQPLSADRFGVRFTADAEFRELLKEVRALASHRQPSGDLLSLMKRGLEAYRRELQKERFGVGRKPRRTRSTGAGASPFPVANAANPELDRTTSNQQW